MIEQFTKSEFETALPVHNKTGAKLWKSKGFVCGEETYSVRVDKQVSIEIRSSVDASGVAKSCGKDSIRAWLVDNDGNPLGSKVSKWTTRKAGWETRTQDVLRTLWGWRKKAGNCKCGEPSKIFKVKKEGKNKGRIFCSCKVCEDFYWITEAKAKS